jgi:hypothetical protein
MGISALFRRRALGAAALLVSLTVFGTAQAVPIYTYTFTQDNYRYGGSPGGTYIGTVTGSFSGALDSTGHISQKTLTAYHFEFGTTSNPLLSGLNWSSTKSPLLLSYIPGDTGSFALIDQGLVTTDFSYNLCIGIPAGFTCNGGNARGAVASIVGPVFQPAMIVFLAATNSAPVLVGSVVDVGDPVYLATTPIPASLLLFGTAFGGLASLALVRRRAQRSTAAFG